MILDTTGLSAVADDDAALEPILRAATEVAIPVIVLGTTDMAFSNHATGSATKNG